MRTQRALEWPSIRNCRRVSECIKLSAVSEDEWILTKPVSWMCLASWPNLSQKIVQFPSLPFTFFFFSSVCAPPPACAEISCFTISSIFLSVEWFRRKVKAFNYHLRFARGQIVCFFWEMSRGGSCRYRVSHVFATSRNAGNVIFLTFSLPPLVTHVSHVP